jgi:hypothetical protein
MIIDAIVLMDLRELQYLIRTPAKGSTAIGSTLKCISVVDVFLEIEQLKKHGYRNRILKIIKEEKSQFHEACDIGYLQIAMLDTNAIQNGLFIISDDFFNVQLWDGAIKEDTDPAYSIRLVSLKSYDTNCGTQFHLETMGF